MITKNSIQIPETNKDVDGLTLYYYDEVNPDMRNYDINNVIRTQKTIAYLLDNDFTYSEIIKELNTHKHHKELNGDNLNDSLWRGSLMKRNAFYLHKELRITSPAPVFDYSRNKEIIFPYYCEMIIRYTITDVLNYFYTKLSYINRKLVDEKTDRKTVEFLIKKYSRIDYVEPLDIILCSIDNHLIQRDDCCRLIDITNTNLYIVNQLIDEMQELEAKGLRRIIWR